MGIDVWVPRDRRYLAQAEAEALESEPVEELLTASVPDSAVPGSPVLAEQAIDQPTFFFCFLNYGDLGIACQLPAEDRHMSAGCRRFCDDVAFALQADKKTPSLIDLHWPLVQSGTIDQSATAAKHLVRQNFNRLPEETIVFGSGFAQYVVDVVDIVVGRCYQSERGRTLVADEIATYRGTPQRKRTLWQELKKAKLGNGHSSI
jgi:hypothetical protein